jgi:hypothetical protein
VGASSIFRGILKLCHVYTKRVGASFVTSKSFEGVFDGCILLSKNFQKQKVFDYNIEI